MAQDQAEKTFIKTEISTTNCYLGEPVVVSFTLYSSVPANTSGQRSPAFYGFSVLDLVNYKESHPGLAEWNGKIYATSILRKVLLYPVQHGKLLIDPMYVEAVTEGFDSIRGGKANIEKEIISQPLEVTVKALPVPRPKDFTGAVGVFRMSSQAEKENFPLNQQGKLLVVVEGRGNFIQAGSPSIEWPEGIQGYEPSVKEKFTNTDSGITGMRIYDFPFSVDSTGTYTIPPVTFSYFNGTGRNYFTLRGDTITINVLPAQTINQIAVASGEKNAPVVLISLIVLAIGAISFLLITRNKRKRQQEQQPSAMKTTAPSFSAASFRQMPQDEKAEALIATIDRFLSSSPHLIQEQQRTEARQIRYELQGMIYANALEKEKLDSLTIRTLKLLKVDHSEYL